LFEYARSLSKTGAYEKSNAVLLRAVKISADPMIYNIMGKNYQAKRQYGDASICFRKAANLMPSLMYPYYLLALLYEETGEQQKASEAAAAFLAKKAKVESTATKEMREKMKELLEN
jgi:tetratricopeptide (TPR) repeat protein